MEDTRKLITETLKKGNDELTIKIIETPESLANLSGLKFIGPKGQSVWTVGDN